ncbi:hypothetical protein F4805DRAFT_409339 [Annulohypoxylon moriforme]|nr:hypothetical protein F4805DRAFT_409339 [Annulohypoxylon moriforme]
MSQKVFSISTLIVSNLDFRLDSGRAYASTIRPEEPPGRLDQVTDLVPSQTMQRGSRQYGMQAFFTCEIGKICMFLVVRLDEPIMELKPRVWVSPTNATTFSGLYLRSLYALRPPQRARPVLPYPASRIPCVGSMKPICTLVHMIHIEPCDVCTEYIHHAPCPWVYLGTYVCHVCHICHIHTKIQTSYNRPGNRTSGSPF